MKFELQPYSKEQQLAGHQREKDTPKYKPKRFNRRKRQTKKVDYKGIKIPSRAKRSEFTLKDKQKIIELYGDGCLFCYSPYVEYHHRKFRSGLGRNNPRNGAPLCNLHHRQVHEQPELAEKLREEARERFSEDYFKDKYDLWKEGKIERPTDELFERFFEGVEKVD
ncbi:HNH endonuclease signature motif containing protein [Pseudobacillus sp. FSL P4-0506]|uniref:HNH endonuclease signature motif containing protein n=1 Tax=Pseudobacillus sp. FSL P4-0506 TaxID=2921576 RepID=UPI0030F63DCA